jgi:CDP-paratose 2-epimerase
MKLLITGGCGFLGSNLASEALRRGIDLTVFDNLSRLGGTHNLTWLQAEGKFNWVYGDIRNQNDVTSLVAHLQPDVVFHLAGQVAMTISLADPRKDFETNVLGSFNLLEAVRQFSPHSSVVYSSTNKVYGDLEQFTYEEQPTRYICKEWPHGFNEQVRLDFQSPYGCSKGATDQYMLDYARMFGLQTVVFRHSSMYGGRQFASYDQGWIGWFCKQAVDVARGERQPFTISGNGKQVRDVLHADDMIRLYFGAAENIGLLQGKAFNVGGGIGNSLSLLELFAHLEAILSISLDYTKLPVRSSDQKVFIADATRLQNCLDWSPQVTAPDGIARMVKWIEATL